jgi:hypothetical protein
MKCSAVAKSGRQCNAHALTGGSLCYLHANPETPARLGTRGGGRRAIFSPDAIRKFSTPETIADVQQIVGQSIVDARQGRIEPRVANCVAATWIKAFAVRAAKRGLTRSKNSRI